FPNALGSAGKAVALDSTGANAYLAGSVGHIVDPNADLLVQDNDVLVIKIDNTTGAPDMGYGTYGMMIFPPNPGNETLNGIQVNTSGRAFVVGTVVDPNHPDVTNGYIAEVESDGLSIVASRILETETGFNTLT